MTMTYRFFLWRTPLCHPDFKGTQPAACLSPFKRPVTQSLITPGLRARFRHISPPDA
ncbi:MAG: hypothetical protein GYB20_04745 [Oceanospirillales bacterium]|nr:hypothetical protein [Oceanospirillales bacterium]MBR9886991.1 hypothetical protein [Oceanospirillales bacterium]